VDSRERAGEKGRPLLPLLLAAVALASCRHDINLLGPRDGGGIDTTGPGMTDGGADRAGEAGSDTIVGPGCTAPGVPIQLPTAGGPTCAAALETRAHRFVLCACETMNAPARIRTDSFTVDPASFDESGAALGFDSDLVANAEVRAGGAFYVAGAGGIRAADQIRSEGSLRVGGPLTLLSDGASADVNGDAYVAGNITGSVQIDGTLHAPSTAVLGSDVRSNGRVTEAVTVPPPCDCSAGFVDIAGAIASAAAANDNAAIGLAPSRLAAVPLAATIELPCGHFYLDQINADAPVVLIVRGRALLAVGGDVRLHAGLTVVVDPSAELDLLVSGWLSADGAFGAAGAAARFRVWVAGTDSVTFDNGTAVHAVIHAPFAPFSAPNGISLYGSLLARSASLGADSTLHFDRAILAAGTVCGEPAAPVVP